MEKRSLNNFVETGDELAKTMAEHVQEYGQLIETSK
jgi:hypothetical protein